MADLDPLGLFPASKMAEAARQGQSRFYSSDEVLGPPNTIRALAGIFRFTGEDMTPIAGYTLTSQAGAFVLTDPGTTKLTPPVPAYVGPGDVQTFSIWASVARGYSAAKAATGTTKAFQVVDSGGINPQDIVVLPSGLVDIATLTTWIGAHGTARVKTLYDQVGTNNWTQATTSRMPIITMNAINSLPAMTFSSANTTTLLTASALSIAQPLTALAVAKRTANFTTNQNIIAGNGPDQELSFFTSANSLILYNGAVLTATQVDNAFHVIQATINTTSSTINVDGLTQVTGDSGPASGLGTTVSLGAYPTGALYLDGMIAEAGVYTNTYNSAAQSNTRTAYGL
jgi:hypothetical protein